MKASLANFRIAIFIITPSDGRTRAVMLCDTWPNNGADLFCVLILQFKYFFHGDDEIILFLVGVDNECLFYIHNGQLWWFKFL